HRGRLRLAQATPLVAKTSTERSQRRLSDGATEGSRIVHVGPRRVREASVTPERREVNRGSDPPGLPFPWQRGRDHRRAYPSEGAPEAKDQPRKHRDFATAAVLQCAEGVLTI